MDRNLPEIEKKKGFSIDNYGTLLISLVLLFFMGRVMWASGSTGNRISAAKIEKWGKAYIEQNYPGLYERVHTQNSGTAYQQQDGTWSVHYFEREEPNNMFSPMTDLSFTLIIDENLNIISDGYQEYYQKGGSVYSKYSNLFYRDIYKYLGGTDQTELLIEGDYKDRLNRYDFERTGFYKEVFDENGTYTGDYLDPDKKYDAKELYAKYGYIQLKFFMESGGYADYTQVVNSVHSILENADMPYNKMRIYMWFRDSDVIFCDGSFAMADFDNGVKYAIENHTDVLTQADYGTMLANGQQPPNIEVGSFMDVITEGSKQIAAQNK